MPERLFARAVRARSPVTTAAELPLSHRARTVFQVSAVLRDLLGSASLADSEGAGGASPEVMVP
jgi:hypothetical protein